MKELASHVSADTFPLKFPGIVFSHPSWELKQLLEGFKVFCIVLMKDKSSHKKVEKYDGKNVSLIYCFNFFRNQL